jgi:hypothetical protein
MRWDTRLSSSKAYLIPCTTYVMASKEHSKIVQGQDILMSMSKMSEEKFRTDRPVTEVDTTVAVLPIGSLGRRQRPIQSTLFVADRLSLDSQSYQDVFRTRNLKFVLAQLAVLDRRFVHISQKYKWNTWSTDFYETLYQALWSKGPAVPLMPSPLLEGWDERLSFLQGFESLPEKKECSSFGKAASFAKRFLRVSRK